MSVCQSTDTRKRCDGLEMEGFHSSPFLSKIDPGKDFLRGVFPGVNKEPQNVPQGMVI